MKLKVPLAGSWAISPFTFPRCNFDAEYLEN